MDELKKALSDDEIENPKQALDEIESCISESELCKSLEFFGLKYNYRLKTLTAPQDFKIEQAVEIIDCYLDIVEWCEDSEQTLKNHKDETIKQAKAYDDFTIEHRGADDGTFDYAGTYMYSLFDMMKLGCRIFNIK